MPKFLWCVSNVGMGWICIVDDASFNCFFGRLQSNCHVLGCCPVVSFCYRVWVLFWCKGVLDEGVSSWIVYNYLKWNKLVSLLSFFLFIIVILFIFIIIVSSENFQLINNVLTSVEIIQVTHCQPLWLLFLQCLSCSQQESFESRHGSTLCCWWNFKFQFRNNHSCRVTLDYLSIEITWFGYMKNHAYPPFLDFSTKRYL
mmetsp:Transcript_5305/g.8205  ORF Transcript_5305/g.8205 Transcript_5305/m.8205 type:complete len:200 (-) Transcript_5305:220-819(-)